MQNPLSAVLSSRKGKDVLPYKYSTKKNSRVNKYFAIFGFVLILAACFSYKRKFVVQEKMNKHVQENSRNVETLSKTVQEMNTEIGLHLKRMETLKLTNTDLKRAKEELERNRDELKVNVGNGMKTKDDIKMLGENQDLKNEVENLKANDSNASLLMNRLIDKVQRDSYRDVFERCVSCIWDYYVFGYICHE
jgi:predicted RNase H-like nuclease (RuvC/YqgF family)